MAERFSRAGEVVDTTRTEKRVLFWAPRILGIAFALFLSMFALDVFSEIRGFWPTTLALIMHLIPTAIVVLILIIAWRWEWIGALLFGGAGIWYLAWALNHLSWVVAISGPSFLVSALFLVDWVKRKELRARP